MKRLLSLFIALFGINFIGMAQGPQQMFWALNKCRLPMAQLTAKPSAAYSLRRLNCNYLGPAIKVRRNGSSSGTTDIGFLDNGSLDTNSLKSYVSGTREGYIVTWYDQSGNGNDLTQSTNSKQPRIVNNGVIEREGGIPAILFIDNTDIMLAPSMDIQSFSAVRKAYDGKSSSGYQYLVSVPANADFSIRCGNVSSFKYGDSNPDDFWYTGSMYINNVLTSYYPTSTHCIYANCSSVRTSTTFSLSSTFMDRGMQDNDPVFELIVFSKVLSSTERTSLYSDQKAYYGTL